MGLRSLGPVWSRPTIFGHGVPFRFPSTGDTGPGLTDPGKALVKECNALRIMLDLSHLNEAGFWDVARLSDAPLTTDFWFEMDVEIVASASPPPHFGFWLWTGVATYEGHRLCVYSNNWAHSYWTSGGSEYEQIAEAWAGWALMIAPTPG